MNDTPLDREYTRKHLHAYIVNHVPLGEQEEMEAAILAYVEENDLWDYPHLDWRICEIQIRKERA